MKELSEWRDCLRRYCLNRLFLSVAVLKLVCGSLFDSHLLHDYFIPFVSYFVDSRFSNPWDEFLRRGILEAFPHSSTMLLLMGVPQLLGAWIFHGSANIPYMLQLFLARVPIFLADLGIYLVLCRWFETQWRKVLFLYWCSPVLFLINYWLGQPDVIPTAFLVLSVWYAVRLSPTKSGTAFALGMAAKHHLAAAIPLMVYYLWKKGIETRKTQIAWMFLLSLSCGLAILMGPLLFSQGYRTLVLGAKESSWVYDLSWNMPQGMKILFCPLVVFGLIVHFFSYERLTKDALILYIGLLYTTLIILVPPKAGWAYWGFPFLCYFLIRHDVVSYLAFWAYNVSFLLYYLVFSPTVAPPGILHRWAMAYPNGEDLVFTFMNASLALVALWMYRVGVKSYVRYKSGHKTKAIGIGGDSASGKHTLADTLTAVLGVQNTVRLHGDDYHRWPREHPAWKSQTHLDPRSNYFRQPVDHILELKSGSTIQKSSYDHALGQFTDPSAVSSNWFVLFEGLHPFVFQRMRDIFDIKIFVMAEEPLRRFWKIRRDTRDRGHPESEVLAEIARREQDSQQFIQPQEQFADWVMEYVVAREGNLGSFETEPESSWLKARHRLSSQVVEIEDLTEELKKCNSLSCSWSMEPNLRRQVLEIQGELPAEQVEVIANRLFPELSDMTGIRPIWSENLKGIQQLIFICLLFGLERS
jgi:uridine kinase